MNHQINEQLDMMDELLQQLIHRFTSLEEKITGLSERKQPDHLAELNILGEELARFKRDFNQMSERLLHQTSILTERIATIPQVIPMKHHFDKRSKGFIIGATILLLVTAVTAGMSLSLWSENQLLHENSLKFRMIRVADPAMAVWADSTYYRNPEGTEQITEQRETEAVTQQQAEITAKQKEQEALKAKAKVEKLKKK